MSRPLRIVVPGVPHHITQRGNRGQEVFFNGDDRQRYIVWLGECATKRGVKIWAYCLMPNHVHLVAVPASPNALGETLRDLQMRHAQRVNTDHGWEGHLWQGRYFSCPLDNAHLWEAVRYVERNPLRAGLVEQAQDFPWSSAAPHCGMRSDPALSWDLPLLKTITDWAGWLRLPEDPQRVRTLRARTTTGRPCGSEAFVKELETVAGRALQARPRGRPRKSK